MLLNCRFKKGTAGPVKWNAGPTKNGRVPKNGALWPAPKRPGYKKENALPAAGQNLLENLLKQMLILVRNCHRNAIVPGKNNVVQQLYINFS